MKKLVFLLSLISVNVVKGVEMENEGIESDPVEFQEIVTLRGHSDSVSSVSWFSGGLVSGSRDKTVKTWSPLSGNNECIKTLIGHSGMVHSVCSLSDDQLLASGSSDKTVRIWKPDESESIAKFTAHNDRVNSVSSSPENLLASGSRDKTVRVWDLTTMGNIETLKGHDAEIHATSWPSANLLASGSSDNTVKIWDLRVDNKCIKTLRGHALWVDSVSCSPAGLLASGSGDKTVRIWDLRSERCLHALQVYPYLDDSCSWSSEVSWSPDGQLLASGLRDQTVNIWDLDSATCLQTLSGHERMGLIFFSATGETTQIDFSVDWSPDELLVSGSNDKTIKVWKKAKRELAEIEDRVGEDKIERDSKEEPDSGLHYAGTTDSSTQTILTGEIQDQQTQLLRDARNERDQMQEKLEEAQRIAAFAFRREQERKDYQERHASVMEELQDQVRQAQAEVTSLNNQLLAQQSNSMEKELQQALKEARQELEEVQRIAALAYQRDQEITALQERNAVTLQELEDQLRESQEEVNRFNNQLLDQQRNADEVSQEEIKQTQDKLERAQEEFKEAIGKIAELTAWLKASRQGNVQNVTFCSCCTDWCSDGCCDCCKECNEPCKGWVAKFCPFSLCG